MILKFSRLITFKELEDKLFSNYKIIDTFDFKHLNKLLNYLVGDNLLHFTLNLSLITYNTLSNNDFYKAYVFKSNTEGKNYKAPILLISCNKDLVSNYYFLEPDLVDKESIINTLGLDANLLNTYLINKGVV